MLNYSYNISVISYVFLYYFFFFLFGVSYKMLYKIILHCSSFPKATRMLYCLRDWYIYIQPFFYIPCNNQ